MMVGAAPAKAGTQSASLQQCATNRGGTAEGMPFRPRWTHSVRETKGLFVCPPDVVCPPDAICPPDVVCPPGTGPTQEDRQ
jgi:hypothetical protein